MPAVHRLCLLGFGELGSTLAEDLLRHTGVELAVWDILFADEHSRPSRSFAALGGHPRLAKATSAMAAATGCDLVISAVTADQAVAAAADMAPGLRAQAWYVDVNSVSPGTKWQVRSLVEAVGARFVEAAVMAPIGPQRSATKILLAGPGAEEFLPVARSLGFTGTAVLSAIPGRATASKMCRSVIVKGMEALVTEALAAARFYGVEDEVLNSLDNLFPHPDWRAHAHYLIGRSLAHGTRRGEEMQQVADTLRQAGVVPWMSEACRQRQQWAGSLGLAGGGADLGLLLDEIAIHSVSEAEL